MNQVETMMDPDLLQENGARFAERLYTAASPRGVVEVAGESVVALIDSGAEVNIISRALAQKLSLVISENVVLNMLAPAGRHRAGKHTT